MPEIYNFAYHNFSNRSGKSRQKEGNSYSSSIELAKFQDYALCLLESEISDSRKTNFRVWIYINPLIWPPIFHIESLSELPVYMLESL